MAKQAIINDEDEQFEYIWKNRPRRSGSDSKANAKARFKARLKEGHTAREIAQGSSRYGKWCASERKIGTSLVMRMETFLGPGLHFQSDYAIVQNSNRSTKDIPMSEQINDRLWAYN